MEIVSKKRENSIYEYNPEFLFRYENWNSDIRPELLKSHVLEKIKKKTETQMYGEIEIAILKLLYKYRYLNEYNMRRELHMKLHQKLHKPNYDKNLKDLYKDGTINKYVMKKEKNNVQVVYTLSDAGYEYMAKTYPALKKTYSFNTKEVEELERYTPDILERMSLNQCHIAIRESLHSAIKEEVYYSNKKTSSKKIPMTSLIKLIPNKQTKQHIYIATIPTYKTEKTFIRFAKRLLNSKIVREHTKRKNASFIMVVPCESTLRMKEIFKKIRQVKELRNTNILFVLDKSTAYNNCLDWLFLCELEAGAVTYTNCTIKQLEKDYNYK